MHAQLEELERLAPGLLERLSVTNGVEGVALGGSRARGSHTADSDFDLGLYYSDPLDIEALQRLADEYGTVATEITQPGGWGPWVDGGGWLVVNDVHIDFIYRNVERVSHVWDDCKDGRVTNEIQAGHPLGYWSHAYAGELALAIPSAGCSTELLDLRDAMAAYPARLSDALVAKIWESSFSVANARKAIAKLDVAYVAGCLFRSVGVMAHSLHGHGGTWLINEKGAVESAATMPAAPVDLARRVGQAFESLRPSAEALDDACTQVQTLIDEAVVNMRTPA